MALANRKENDFKFRQAQAKPLSFSKSSKADHSHNASDLNQKAAFYQPSSIDQNLTKAKNRDLLKAPSTNHLENIYLGLGIAFYQQKKYKEALFYFKKSIEVDDTF